MVLNNNTFQDSGDNRRNGYRSVIWWVCWSGDSGNR